MYCQRKFVFFKDGNHLLKVINPTPDPPKIPFIKNDEKEVAKYQQPDRCFGQLIPAVLHTKKAKHAFSIKAEFTLAMTLQIHSR